MTTLPNPARPLVGVEVDFTQGPPAVPGSQRCSINAPYRRLQVPSLAVDRGRQYELDAAQAGTCTLQVIDPLELLNPDNAASPFNQGSNLVTPYRCIWVWAMWPVLPTSGNINNTGVSSSYDPSFETGTGGWARAGGTTTAVTSTAQHFAGAQSLLVTQSTAGSGFGVVNSWPTAPGITYTLSVYVYLPSAATVTLVVTDAAGATHTASTSVTTTWTRLSVTWDSVDTLEQAQVYSSTTTGFYVDAAMVNFGATAQTFTTTGPALYPLFTGYVERWPTTYDMAGFRGVRPLAAVDALALLAITEISQSYKATILADGPTVYIPYDDASGPPVVQRPQGGAPFQGYQFIGNFSSAVTFGGDQFLDGAPAVTVVQQNATPPVSNDNSYICRVGANNATVPVSPGAGFTLEFWARTTGFIYVGAGIVQVGENPNTEPFGPQYLIGFYTASTGQFCPILRAPDHVGDFGLFVQTSPTFDGIPDEQWHYFLVALNPSNGSFRVVIDTNYRSYIWSPMTDMTLLLNDFFAGVTTVYGNLGVSSASVAHMAAYPVGLTSAQAAAHYQRGAGYAGEISGARVTRLLGQYWGGPTQVAAGYAALSADHDYDTRFLLDVLQEIQDTERGLVYANRSGTVVFEDRESRYATQTASVVFGEHPTSGEVPYETYQTDHDPTYLFTQVNLTRPGNQNYPPKANTAAAAKYGTRVLTQDVKVTTDFDLDQAAIYYLNRYAAPKTRISQLALNPAANPALWPTALPLEISQRVTVTRRTAITTSSDYYLEKVSHRIDGMSGEWTVTLQASPVFVPSAWVLGDATRGVLGSTTAPIY